MNLHRGGPPGSADGDREEQFRQLHDRYYRSVCYRFQRLGFPLEEARDLAQETFLNAFKGIEDFRREAQVKTWLFRIAGNVAKNALRHRAAGKRQALEVSLEDDGLSGYHSLREEDLAIPVSSPTSLDNLLVSERVKMMREALADLPDQMRRCALLRIDQDLKYREIAKVLQISIETVKSQVHQAKQRLKETISSRYNSS